MAKQSAGANVAICPMPVTLVGSMVDGHPNFMAVGWIARVNMSPPLVSLGLNHGSATRSAINPTQTTSYHTMIMLKILQT